MTDEGYKVLAAYNPIVSKNKNTRPLTWVIIPLDEGQITAFSYVEAHEDISWLENDEEKYDQKWELRCLTDEELENLINNINISSIGSQSQEIRESELSFFGDYVSDEQTAYY